jgi:hypothetical protein
VTGRNRPEAAGGQLLDKCVGFNLAIAGLQGYTHKPHKTQKKLTLYAGQGVFMAKLDLTSKIERLEAFEERLMVNFKSLSAFMDADEDEDDDYIMVDVRGEIHAATGTEIKNDITMVIAIYDKSDRVIGTSESTYYSEDFFGFDTFSESVHISVRNIAKIRIYPKKA